MVPCMRGSRGRHNIYLSAAVNVCFATMIGSAEEENRVDRVNIGCHMSNRSNVYV